MTPIDDQLVLQHLLEVTRLETSVFFCFVTINSSLFVCSFGLDKFIYINEYRAMFGQFPMSMCFQDKQHPAAYQIYR